MAVDAAAYGGLSFVLAITWGLVVYLTTGRAAPDTAALWLVTSVLPWLVVFLYPLVTGAGESLGQRTVWLAVVPDDGGAGLSARARVRRGLAGGALWGLLQVLADAATTFDVGVLGGAGALGFVVGAVVVAAVPFSVGKRGLSGRVARYRLADARQPELRPSRPSR